MYFWVRLTLPLRGLWENFSSITFHSIFAGFFSPMKAVEAKTIQIAYSHCLIFCLFVCFELKTLSLKVSTKVIWQVTPNFCPKLQKYV